MRPFSKGWVAGHSAGKKAAAYLGWFISVDEKGGWQLYSKKVNCLILSFEGGN